MTDLPDPRPGYRWTIDAEEGPRRPRRGWPVLVSIGVVAVLMVVAWFAGEWLARDITERTVRGQIVQSAGLPADQEIDVAIEGFVIPQLIAGTFDRVDLSSRDVAFGAFEGDVAVSARDVAIRGEKTLGSASATVSLDDEQLRRVLGTIDGFPADSVGIDDPEITMTVVLDVLGAQVPIGVGLRPGAQDGQMVLTPATLRLAEVELTAAELRAQFGPLSAIVLRDWSVCIAQWLPAGLTLADLHVQGERLVADVDVASRILEDPELLDTGACG